MHVIARCGLLSLALSTPTAALAQVQLLGSGALAGDARDGTSLAPAILEDGVTPHDQVGGFGSDITYTGVGNLYLALPDRGPADGTTSYRDRAYLLAIDATPGGVSVTLRSTVLLANENGAPFTGSAAAFDAQNSPDSLRLDPEGVRLSGHGSFFVSDEYGPFLYEFAADGERLSVLPVPDKFLVHAPSAVGALELPPANVSGRQANRGMEGLAISPNGKKLFGMMQNALIQDGALDAANARVGLNNRLLELDLQTGVTREYVYQIASKSLGVNEIVAINDHELLVLERDGKAGNEAAVKMIYKIELSGATDVSAIASLPTSGLPAFVAPVQKTPFLNLLDSAFGLKSASFPEKIEGLSFGPDLADGRHVLLVTSDNDFVAAKPSYVYAFAIERAALDYVPQSLSPRIDLRPGDAHNFVNVRSRAALPVGIFGEALLPVSAIDLASLRLSGAGLKARGCTQRDLDGDGLTDLECLFDTKSLQLSCAAEVVTLTGITTTGTPLRATDFVRTRGH